MRGFQPRSAAGAKEQRFADGGFVQGIKPRSAAHAQALNQAPDTIPGMFKPGEFVLPPDTVHAMGGPKVLQGIVDATHTPAPDVAVVPRGFQPQVFFSQGGGADDEVRRQKANSFGDAAAAAADPAVRQVQPAPNSPINTFPGNRLQGDSGFSGAPVGRAAAPATAPADSGGFSYADNNQAVGQDIKDAWNKGNYGEAAGKTVAGTVGFFTTPAIDLAVRGGAAAWEGAKGFGRGLFGIDAQEAPKPAPAAEPATPAQNPTAVSDPQALSSAGATAKPAAPAFDFDTFQPQSGEGAFRNEQTGRVTRLQSEPTGARQQLATPPRGLAIYASEPQRQEVRAPVLNPNGGVFSSMVDFTNQAGQAVQAIAANKGMRNDRKDALDQQRVGLDAASTFAKIEQGDRALGIDGRRADTDQDLAALQADELGLKREAAGFQTRAAQRKQSFQEAWAKGTKEQREQLQQMYPDLMPTDKEKPRFEVVRGRNNPMTGEPGQDYVLRMNPNGTVEQVPVEGMGQGQPKPMPKNKGERVVGNLYVDNNGQLVKWTEKGAISAQ